MKYTEIELERERRYQAQETSGKLESGQRHLEGYCGGKLVSPAKRRAAVAKVQEKSAIIQRRACRAVQISQRVAQYTPISREDEDLLSSRIIDLACNYRRYGYHRIIALLRAEGWCVNHKRVERIWSRRLEGSPKATETTQAVAQRW